MNIIQTSIIISIILFAAQANEYSKTNTQIDMLLGYKVPEKFSECEGAQIEDGKESIQSAFKSSSIPQDLKPDNLEQLEIAGCAIVLPSANAWFKFQFKRGNQVCTIYSVSAIHLSTLRSGAKNSYTSTKKYSYLKKKTEIANRDPNLVHCIDINEENQDQIQNDIQEEEQKAPISKISSQYLETPNEFDKDVLPSDYNHINALKNYTPPKSLFSNHKTENQVVQEEDGEEKVEDEDETDFSDLPELELMRHPGQVYSDLPELKLMRHPGQIYSDLPELKLMRHPGQIYSDHHEAFNNRLGGWEACDAQDTTLAPKMLNVMATAKEIMGVVAYPENVIHCERQVVNGMNYNVILGFNDKKCQIAFHNSIQNELSILTTATKIAEVAMCSEFFAYRE